MFMRNSLLVIVILLLSLSCRDKIACPAFQSTYILDDSTRMAYYSYVWKLDQDTREKYLASALGDGDSLAAGNSGTMRYYDYVEDIIQPRVPVKRSKYGIVKYEPMWLKNYKLKSAPKENILGPDPIEDQELAPIDVGEFIASDFADSLSADSTSFASVDSTFSSPDTVRVALNSKEKPKKKEVKYLYRYDPDSLNNVEQEYYNKYYGELLIDYSQQRKKQEEKLSNVATNTSANEAGVASDSTVAVEQGKKRFGRKNKQESPTENSAEETEGNQPEEDPEGIPPGGGK